MSKLIAFLIFSKCNSCKSCDCTSKVHEAILKEYDEVRPCVEYTPHPNHRLVVWLGDGKNKKQLSDEVMKKLLSNTDDFVEYLW